MTQSQRTLKGRCLRPSCHARMSIECRTHCWDWTMRALFHHKGVVTLLMGLLEVCALFLLREGAHSNQFSFRGTFFSAKSLLSLAEIYVGQSPPV